MLAWRWHLDMNRQKERVDGQGEGCQAPKSPLCVYEDLDALRPQT